MLELDDQQRDRVADKLADAANIAVGGLVFGQSFAARSFSYALALLGISLWVMLMGWSVLLTRVRRP